MSSSVIRPVGHSSTARFWYLYVDLVDIFLLFDRACRANDVSLYTYALGLMCPMFFATRKSNYVCWMSLYRLTEHGSNASWDPDEL